MKILLFCHLGQIPEYAEYIHALRNVEPVQSVFLTMGQEEYDRGQSVGAFDVVKDILPEQSELDAAEVDPSLAGAALKRLEDRLGSTFVNRDILVDRFFVGQPLANVDRKSVPVVWNGPRTKAFMYLIARRLEEEIRAFGPDFMFVETSFAPTRMAWRLAREQGIPAGGFMSVRFWPDRLYLETGIGYDWQEAREAYRELTERPMEGSEREQVTERLQKVRAERTKPAYLQTEHAKGAPNFFRRLLAMRPFSGPGSWLGRQAQTFTRNPKVLPRNVFLPAAKYRRYRNGLEAKRYLFKHQTPFGAIRTKKYAIYFLHVQPEITVEGMAFEYQEQAQTLLNILASLPADMDLVVKEHSPMLGYRTMDLYSQLVHMPGLILADTREDSHELITHASVVVTLTGTVALEAILYGIPAIVLGSIYFDQFAGIYKPENLQELKTLLSEPDKLQGATEEDALRALGSLLRASQPGNPSRVDVTARGIDPASANVMISELKRVCHLA